MRFTTSISIINSFGAYVKPTARATVHAKPAFLFPKLVGEQREGGPNDQES